jgi:subtilisin family serine protease
MGVKVAVVDTGFADHPYFFNRGYHIRRIAAPGASHPEIDDSNHGTFVLANLLACAPGADAYGVKYDDVSIAFAQAALIPGIRIISLSWMFEIQGAVPDWMLVFEFLVQIAIRQLGVVVVVAAGNSAQETTPACLPWVIAVGGVNVLDQAFSLAAWPYSTSFRSTRFPSRLVPDLCGVASDIDGPLPPINMMCQEGGTSCATPQVAGVVALLLQNNPALTPFEVKALLMLGARDVSAGKSFSGAHAKAGWDAATGYGLVDAMTSWQLVP